MATIRIGGDELITLADCPDFTFTKTSPIGDQTASVSLPFVRGMTLPRADSPFTIEDDATPIWDGITGPIDSPEMASCAGPATIAALGYGVAMTKRGEAERVYGPRWVAPVIGGSAHTLEGAVKEAVSQLAPDVFLFDANIDSTGIILGETENFQGQAAGDVLGNLAARTQHLATPVLWHVRQKVFDWKFLDIAPRYRVYMANGAKVTPKYDPQRVVNRVIVGWGKDQTATWPATISHVKRRQIVDLYLNAGIEVRDYATALSLAQGIYGRMQLLSPEWSMEISIPSSCPVEQIVAGAWTTIPTIRMEPGYAIWIPDIDHGYMGPQFDIPDTGFMTRVSWQNKMSTMSVSVGEPRASGTLSRLARRVVAAGVSPLNIWGYLGRDFSAPLRGTGKTPLNGPALPTAVDPTKPPPVDYRIPAVSTEHNQILGTHLPPMPVKPHERIYSEDGEVFPTGPLDTGEYSDEVPPCVITHWEFSSNLSGSIVIQIHRVAKDAGGFNRTTGTGDSQQYVRGALVGTITVSGAKIAQAAVNWRIAEDATLVYTIVSVTNFTMFNLRMNGNRIILGHPAGLDTLPAVRARSA